VLRFITSRFTEFGPNATTFVFLAEIFPVRVRTTSHGICATAGKVGAALGTFTFPLLQADLWPLRPHVARGPALFESLFAVGHVRRFRIEQAGAA
jgi:nitrate/nitrite transporter NarK